MSSVSYTSLEPSYTSLLGEQAKAPTFKTGDAAELFTSTSFLYSLAIMAIIVVAGWRYLLAGAWRMQASAGGIAKSNEEIRRVTLGLLGVLSMFTLLYTFNKGLLRGDVGLGGLKASNIVSGTGGDFGGGGAAGDTGGGTGTSTPVSTDGSEAANRQILNAAGITRIISSTGQTTPCTEDQLKQSKPSCTNLAGMPSSVISMLVDVRGICSGRITVTGGTEPGHRTHGVGKQAVDVDDDDSQLNACIRAFPAGPNVGTWCTATFVKFGFIFCDERGTSHWHIYK